jgi:hypothetical protein
MLAPAAVQMLARHTIMHFSHFDTRDFVRPTLMARSPARTSHIGCGLNSMKSRQPVAVAASPTSAVSHSGLHATASSPQ